MTQTEYARHAGVNRSTVCRWLQNGRIQAESDGSIDPEKADRLREATESPMPHHQARKAQIAQEKKAQSEKAETPSTEKPSDGGDGMGNATVSEIGAALKLETYKLQKAKAETANLELDRLSGLLVERSEVDHVLADIGATLRGHCEGLPDRYAPIIAAHKGEVNAIHHELEGLARDLLNAMADHMRRKTEQL
jgi:hypothetical protein